MKATLNVVATGATGFQWQSSTDGGSSFSNIGSATASSYTTAPTTQANDGSQYRVVVSGATNSVTSNVVILTVSATAIAPTFTTQPSNVAITEGQNAQYVIAVSGTPTPTLQWQLSTNSGSSWNNINGETNSTFTVVTPVLANSGRQYRAVASNSAGTVNSNAATLTVTAVPAGTTSPAAPSGLVATAVSSSSIGLTWADNSNNENGFKIERATSAGGPFTLITTTAANVTNYSNIGLTASTAYYYRVRATNSAGDSANTSVAPATTQAPVIVNTTVYLYPTIDNVVIQASLVPTVQTTAYPASDDLSVGCDWIFNINSGLQEFRCAQSLMKFDVAALSGKTIDSATLTLKTYYAGTGDFRRNWYIAALLSSWNETVTWNTANSFYYEIGTSQVFNPPTSTGQVYNIGLTSIVQAWASGLASNNGLLMDTTSYVFPYATSPDRFGFYSSQTGVGWGPTLTVTYH